MPARHFDSGATSGQPHHGDRGHDGEAPTKSCLYDSANALLRRGRHGSFKVSKVTPADLPDWLDNTRARYQRVVIAANNPNCWEIKSKDLSVL